MILRDLMHFLVDRGKEGSERKNGRWGLFLKKNKWLGGALQHWEKLKQNLEGK